MSRSLNSEGSRGLVFVVEVIVFHEWLFLVQRPRRISMLSVKSLISQIKKSYIFSCLLTVSCLCRHGSDTIFCQSQWLTESKPLSLSSSLRTTCFFLAFPQAKLI